MEEDIRSNLFTKLQNGKIDLYTLIQILTNDRIYTRKD
jgi:hypothetical protein